MEFFRTKAILQALYIYNIILEGIFMQKKKVTFLHRMAALAVGSLLVVGPVGAVTAKAEEPHAIGQDVASEKIYYEEEIFHGYGTMVDADYYVYCDEAKNVQPVVGVVAPSYGSGDSSLTSTCGPISGTNVIVYYDRYYPNLIPDFEPGMTDSDGDYAYFPDLGLTQSEAVLYSLYDLMKIEEVGGTTSANFKSALQTFANNQGYSISYSSFYSSATTVNLTTLTNAINAGKIGVIMCSEYNFISSMHYDTENKRVLIAKNNSTTGHIMMVYGYKTVNYYTNGEIIDSKTFLLVSSGYQTAEKGYMQLNDFSVIDEAWIVTVS